LNDFQVRKTYFSGCPGNGDGQVNPEATKKFGKEAALSDLYEGKLSISSHFGL